MENETITKIAINYVFKDNINRVFNLMKDVRIFKKMMKGMMNVQTNGGDFGTPGTEFTINWKNNFCHLKVAKVIDEDEYKMIQFNLYESTPSDLKFDVFYHYYWNSHEKTTLFVKEYIFDKPTPTSAVDLRRHEEEQLKVSKQFEKYLKKNIDGLEQVESITIAMNIKTLWDIVIDWREFKIHVPMMAEDVTYFGNPEDIGTKFRVKIKNVESDLKVIDLKINEYKREYLLECYNGTSYCPLQVLKFTFVKINENKTLLSFKHIFKQPIIHKYLYAIEENKKQILKELKSALENINNN